MNTDVLIVGGGIVGLATAYQLLSQNPSLTVTILEKENTLAKHQTGNNSGVIHSGLYYKPGSLKATNCIHGYNLLIRFCEENNVPFEICGKIVVATQKDQLPLLDNLFQRGQQNGLSNLRKLSASELKEYEPHATGIAAIHVPQTGIVDYLVVAERYGECIRAKGGTIILGEKVTNIKITGTTVEAITPNKTYRSKLVINCAGLYSDKVASLTAKHVDVKIIPFRGEYYKLTPEKEYLVKNLIYPVPDPNFPFLGVHFTRMMKGGVEAGPNAVLAFRREGYRKRDIHLGELTEALLWPGFQKVVSKYWRTGISEMYRSFSKAAFTRALQELIPEIQQKDLQEGGAGVRAQACDRTGGLVDDFLIIEESHVINVCNAPSPAATSSLAIGETIANLARKRIV
jgi:(S)-2-hydroxyglutarate dehydrogenase